MYTAPSCPLASYNAQISIKYFPKDQALNKRWILSNSIWLKHTDNILQSLVVKEFSVEEWFY